MKKISTIVYIIVIAWVNSSNAQYSMLYDFSVVAEGATPLGSLISDGTFLYGMTLEGGTGACQLGCGVVFKIKLDGTDYTNLFNFNGSATGSHPVGNLFYDGIYMYGMTSNGGINDSGTVFKIKPDGTGYLKLLDFTGINGKEPSGSLISDGTFLYGMTAKGGIHDMGAIFKIKTDGTGYAKLLDFDGIAHGDFPYSSLILDGTFLYGMTAGGGTGPFLGGDGVIFKIKTDGTGFSKLLDFNASTTGRAPTGTFIFDGTFFYGMTSAGGANDLGVIFKIKPDGTGYSKLLDFNGVNGAGPWASLAYDGTFLYGMTIQGGNNGCANASGCGVLFKIKPDGTAYSKLLDFTGSATGQYPHGSLISDGMFLYGMASYGGSGSCMDGCGTIFNYGLTTTSIDERKLTTGYSIYPNPSNGKFTIERDKDLPQTMHTTCIYNIFGEKVYTSEINTLQESVDFSGESDGIYFVNIITEKEEDVRKLIINK